MRLNIDVALRAHLERRGLEVFAYQPQHLFHGTRKLALVAGSDDPWSVTVFRKGVSHWSDGARVGQAYGDTPSDAIRQILERGDLKGSISRLAVEFDRLSAVLRA